MTIEWGSLPDIVTALATIGALVAAGAAWRQAARMFRLEADRDKSARERDRQEQASKVFAWTAVRIENPGPAESKNYGVVIANSSLQAIYDVGCSVSGWDGTPRSTIALSVLPPGAYFLEEDEQFQWKFSRRLRSFEEEIRPVNKSKNRSVLSLSFRDSHNAEWSRDAGGILCEKPVVEKITPQSSGV